MNGVFAVLMLMGWAMVFGCVGGFAYACGCALNEIGGLGDGVRLCQRIRLRLRLGVKRDWWMAA
ncbi:hypothetical protein [Stieleria varia]|uniref:Uncharacterized protein n=1 Tax=Stieleria varia TaxID=2528005 RepID=A0A5C6ALY4_9BACT|nr:hypothetical protein [Stieleria varia]TWU01009.1 hypothetical protein Pla52n_43800 [Stieleria varia]TWU01025.1 hypothetical protein Pla52n_43960 [Stieleria varia]